MLKTCIIAVMASACFAGDMSGTCCSPSFEIKQDNDQTLLQVATNGTTLYGALSIHGDFMVNGGLIAGSVVLGNISVDAELANLRATNALLASRIELLERMLDTLRDTCGGSCTGSGGSGSTGSTGATTSPGSNLCANLPGIPGNQALRYLPVSLASYATTDLLTYYPVGPFTFDGVDYDLQANIWHAAFMTGPNPRVLNVTINRVATAVYTAMNSFWGQATNVSYATIEFFGCAGAYHKVDLFGNVHFRDYNPMQVNDIVDPPAKQMYLSSGWVTQSVTLFPRLDRQKWDLPPAFSLQKLAYVVVTDNGGGDCQGCSVCCTSQAPQQRMFVAGVTIQQY